MPKKIYAVQMSYQVPSEEKDQANKAFMAFDNLLHILKANNEHLDLIYTPFKETTEIPTDQIYKTRASLRTYRDRVVSNFNYFKRMAFRCFVALQPFSSDTQVVKLNKSFVLSIGDIEKQVNRFVTLFSNLESKDFPQTIIKAIENIKKEIAQLEQIIEDRIKNYIQNHILAKSWVDNVSEELQEKVEKKIPLSIELVNERAKQLEDSFKENK